MTTIPATEESEYNDATGEPLTGPTLKPKSISEIDVNPAVLENLALKNLYMAGSISVLELSHKIRLSYAIAEELVIRLQSELLCQVKGMEGNIPRIALTSSGRSRAAELLSQRLPTLFWRTKLYAS